MIIVVILTLILSGEYEHNGLLNMTNIKDLPKASDEQISEWFADARSVIKETTYYTDCLSVVLVAIVEYIAYKKGFTIRDWK